MGPAKHSINLSTEVEQWQRGQKMEVGKIGGLANFRMRTQGGGEEDCVCRTFPANSSSPHTSCQRFKFVPMGEGRKESHTSHCVLDLLANILFCHYCSVPHVTPGVLAVNMVDQSTHISLPCVTEDYFNFQSQQMFNGAVQGCCSIRAHGADVTWGQNTLESCTANPLLNRRDVFLTHLQRNTPQNRGRACNSIYILPLRKRGVILCWKNLCSTKKSNHGVFT